MHNSVSGRVLRTGQPITVKDVLAEPHFHLTDVAQAEGLVSLLSVPLRTKDRIVGVLNLYTGEHRRFEILTYIHRRADSGQSVGQVLGHINGQSDLACGHGPEPTGGAPARRRGRC